LVKNLDDEYSIERFAQHGFYQDVNRRLVALTALRRGQRVVDLGAGTGAVTRMVAAAVDGPGAEVIALDSSQSELEVARSHGAYPGQAWVRYVCGDAHALPQILAQQADAVFFCNAIHLVRDKERLLSDIRPAIRAQGTLSVNTSFFDGAEPPEAEPFYRRWMLKSLRVLKRRYGRSPDRNKAEARNRLGTDDYVRLLEHTGYRVTRREVMTVPMPLGGFQDISRYRLWIEGVLPGVPLDQGSESLIEGACEALGELGMSTVPRSWLLLVATPRATVAR
jgi:ubiquinone/menaquinone biosynthesis C-methylase UbiE